ncbi:hypothetical protein [Streptomyces sp. G9]
MTVKPGVRGCVGAGAAVGLLVVSGALALPGVTTAVAELAGSRE